MKILKNIVKGSGVIITILLIIVVINTLAIKSKQIKVENNDLNINLDMKKAAINLSKGLKFRTISYTEPLKFDYKEFEKLHEYIDDTYPNIKGKLEKEIINKYSLLYKWQGKNKDLKPLILASHMDVVGVEEETLNQWTHEPFSGDISEGKIWGRGARDNKCQLFSILEAVEYLIKIGYEPERTIYLAFGHDEEVLGINGAKNIAKVLENKEVKAECLIDEGGAIVEKALPGLKGQVALIGFGEKGYMTLKLSVKLNGGHSSSPEKNTAIGVISKAIVKLDNYNFKKTMKYIKPTFEYAAPEANLPMKMVMSNMWLTGGILEKVMEKSSETEAMLRTTKVTTIFNSGFKDNVVPAEACAVINLRILPGEKIEDIKEKVIEVIDDKRVNVELYGYYNEAPEASDIDNESFIKVQKSLKQVFPNSISVPYFSSGGSDSKHYVNITKNRYQVTPSRKEKDEKSHGINERISIENYGEYIKTFVQLIKNFNS